MISESTNHSLRTLLLFRLVRLSITRQRLERMQRLAGPCIDAEILMRRPQYHGGHDIATLEEVRTVDNKGAWRTMKCSQHRQEAGSCREWVSVNIILWLITKPAHNSDIYGRCILEHLDRRLSPGNLFVTLLLSDESFLYTLLYKVMMYIDRYFAEKFSREKESWLRTLRSRSRYDIASNCMCSSYQHDGWCPDIFLHQIQYADDYCI
ncbi:hypothetical protein GGS21DRAFT_87260 [Xylaria nigripes]|nr:hypothetical protein GGS21DRAFT_87260 [Xylaria nigripes]